MTTSPASSPLGQRIQQILLERDHAPISLIELQSSLRRQGYKIAEDRLRELLSDRQIFTALADDRYLLRDRFDESPAAPEPATPETRVYLANLPLAQSDYVVLDIETNGLDPAHDQLIQIAALRVCAGRASAFGAWYLHCPPEQLSLSLRIMLHLTDDLVARIAAAPTIDATWPEIRAFLGDLPLVIHNARFDMGFLLQHDPSLTNPVVDTMELALLVAPTLARQRLDALAEHFAIEIGEIDTHAITGIPAGYQFGAATLHNAITDVVVLHLVYRALLRGWQHAPLSLAAAVAALLPEATGVARTAPLDLDAFIEPPPDLAPIAPLVASNAVALLDRLAAHAGLSPRASQRDMIELVAEAFATDRSLLIEAPTGTGKTLGYLLPAVWAARTQGRRIALATGFKNLQDQLAGEVTRLQAVVPFNAQLLKGAANYVCLRDLQQACDDASDAAIDRRFVLAYLVHWAASGTLATLDDLPYWLKSTFPIAARIEREIAVDRASCTERQCPFFSSCHLFAAYRRGGQADIVLINQALWLSEPALMPPFDALVIDEAHNLEDVATSALESAVTEASLSLLLNRLAVPGTRRGALQRILDLKPIDELRAAVHQARRGIGQALRLIAELRATLAAFVAGCDERLDPEQGAHLRLAGAPAKVYPTRWMLVQQALDQIWAVYLAEVLAGLRTIQALLPADTPALYRVISAAHDQLIEQEALLRTILQARRADLVTWIAVNTGASKGGWGFHAAPVSVAPILAERYTPLRSLILTSATLTTGPHDFSFFLDRLGLRGRLDASDLQMLAGALPYASNVLLGLPTYLSYAPAQATMQSYVEELADELALLYRYTDGRALTLFTARARLEQIWARNAAALEAHGIPVLAQRAGAGRQRLVEQFRVHGGAVLYGLRSFWEGVDVPGAALSLVVMEKLPYPSITDPIHAARRELVARQSGREFQDYLFPLMVIQFKQGFGRLLRQDDDQGAVILYDKRVARKSYLRDLLGALPGFQPRDPVAERSRRGFYQLIADRLPGLIDRAAKADFLDSLPDVLSTDLEALVARLAIPDPLPDHDYDEWRPRILAALAALYAHADFRSTEQEAAFRAMLTGRDVVAVLPTGAGKSLCFQLPALLRAGTTVICSPLIALMKDQIDKLHERGIEIAAALMSGQSASEREEILARMRGGRLRLLYLAPERLRDPVVRAALAESAIRQIVVDEAHCVALWGPSFRPDFLVLPQIYAMLPQRPPVAAFTATATPAITAMIADGLQLRDPLLVRASVDRPELRLSIFDRHSAYHAIRSKTDQIQRLMLLVQVADARGAAMLIYVATTKEAEYLARLLQVAGYAARAYHGKMPIQERANVGELFMESLINIVVCTKAFGMGIDKPDIRYVVHFHLPGDLESYFQEIGRAGRDGQPAYAVLLYHASDERIQQFFIDQSRPDGALLANVWRWIAEQPLSWTLDPAAVCERFDIDELALKRALYLLERAGLLKRGPDVTIQASLTLLGEWPAIGDLAPAGSRALLERVCAALPEPAWVSQPIVLADVLPPQLCTPAELEHALILFAVAGGCLYRPWEKGYQITRLAPPETALPPLGSDVVAAQEDKLVRMRAFVHAKGCRWQAIRSYFGEAAGAPCGHCDRCDPEQLYPWSGKTGRDVPDVSDFLDLATTLLELIDWNARRVRDGLAPFGARSLIRILRGDEYALMRYAPPGPAADARRRALRACPYWGVCRTLRRSVAELERLLERLAHEALIVLAEALAGPAGTYQYWALTESGRAQLLSGNRLGWT